MLRAPSPSSYSSSEVDGGVPSLSSLRSSGLRVCLWKHHVLQHWNFCCFDLTWIRNQHSTRFFCARLETLQRPIATSRNFRQKSHDCWRADFQRKVSTWKQTFSHKCLLQFFAVHLSCAVILVQIQLFVYILSKKNGTWGVPHSDGHDYMKKFKRHREHFVRHGFTAACKREI